MIRGRPPGRSFSLVELNMNVQDFAEFQDELDWLMTKYYCFASKRDGIDDPVRTITVTIIPDT